MVSLTALVSLLISSKHVILVKLVLINVIIELPVLQLLTALTTHVNVTRIPLMKMVMHGTVTVTNVHVIISPEEINNLTTAQLVSVRPKGTMTWDSTQEVCFIND